MAQNSKNVVFMYGTLLSGQPNHYFMSKDNLPSVEFIGEAETKLKYPLIIGGKWNLPMLVNHEGEGKIVRGELYCVDKTDLDKLDKFEGHPDFYTRTEIDVFKTTKGCDTKDEVRCFTYFITEHSEDYLQHPHYDKYDSSGVHGKAYVIDDNQDHPDHKPEGR